MLHSTGGYTDSMDGMILYGWDIPLIDHPIRLMDKFRAKSSPEEVPYNNNLGLSLGRGPYKDPRRYPKISKYDFRRRRKRRRCNTSINDFLIVHKEVLLIQGRFSDLKYPPKLALIHG